MTQNSSYSILIVDDTQQNVQVLSQILRDAGYKVLAAFNGPSALNLINKRPPDMILLDVMMPGMSGFEVAESLKKHDEYKSIPIIFLSALDEIEAKMKAFESGGVDYITKPFQHQEVLARIELHLRLKTLEKERESYIKDLKQQRENLEKLNKEKDDILGIISHDMRNPLGGIIGISNFLITEPVDNPSEMEDMLKLIEQSAEKLLALVNDLLNVAIIEANTFSVNLEETDVLILIDDVIQLHQPAAKSKHVAIVTEYPPKSVIAKLDKSKITQVIGNLISNAIKFTKSGGQITIKVETPTNVENKVLRIFIRDTGIGIPDELMPILFKKMSGHQRNGTNGEKGTGLGMPIVKRYVEAHHGTISVSSAPNEGTLFTIDLPQ
ncbi:MAG TPA: hypothetical protein DCE78_00720 [Bacteroidetes bacterium]|nr:hypothetical protein [Bacteroidota bacterium]